MIGFMKSPLNRLAKHRSADPPISRGKSSNPFDSDDEDDDKQTHLLSKRTTSKPLPNFINAKTNPFDSDDDDKQTHWLSKRTTSEPLSNFKNSKTNPFDSDDEDGDKQTHLSSKRITSEPLPRVQNSKTNPFDDSDTFGGEVMPLSASNYSYSTTQRTKYKNGFCDSGGLENQSVQELENYSVYKSEETTKTVNSCLKIAEDIREDATKTLITLHQQGQQITRTHAAAADIDRDLSRGEKLLGSLGGIFSRTWKPTRTRPITGPVINRDDPVRRKANHLEQREKLGLSVMPSGQSKSQTPLPETTDALQKVEHENAKQDDALSDLSDLLGELKEMAVDMGSELERQNKSLEPLNDDVDELSLRVQNANRRGRRLLKQ